MAWLADAWRCQPPWISRTLVAAASTLAVHSVLRAARGGSLGSLGVVSTFVLAFAGAAAADTYWAAPFHQLTPPLQSRTCTCTVVFDVAPPADYAARARRLGVHLVHGDSVSCVRVCGIGTAVRALLVVPGIAYVIVDVPDAAVE